MQCSCFSARCQPVASSQSTFWNPSHYQCYPLWWKASAKKDKVILLDKLFHSINIRKQLPSVQLCTWGAPNPPLSPTGSAFWAAALPLQGIKRWNLSGEGVYSRQCRVRISSCYSSKHNNFMLTKTIISSTHKPPSTRSGKALSIGISMTALTNATALAHILMKRFSLRLKSSWHCQLNNYYGPSKWQRYGLKWWGICPYILNLSGFWVLLACALSNLHETLAVYWERQ